MGHIKEPKNIDLQINSGNVTKEDKQAISEYISKLKLENQTKSKGSSRTKEYSK